MKTDPAPPSFSIPPRTDEDTGPISQSDRIKAEAAICIQDAFDHLAETQRMLEVAKHVSDRALGMVADQEAERQPTRLERIEAKVDRMLTMLVAREEELLKQHDRIVKLETWKQRHSVAPHCDTCEFKHPEIEVQEG